MAWRIPRRRAACAPPSTPNFQPSTRFEVARIALALPASLGRIGGGVGIDSVIEFGNARTGTSRPIFKRAAVAGGPDRVEGAPATAARLKIGRLVPVRALPN